MAATQVSASLHLPFNGVRGPNLHKSPIVARLPTSSFSPKIASFTPARSLVMSAGNTRRKFKARANNIRSEQSSNEGSGLDVWLGRLAMIGFAVALTVEISTGKGLLENFGLTSPLPTVALAVTVLVGGLTAVFIFQSASKS